MSYKINQPIRVRYKTIPLISGMTDLYLTPTNPAGIDQAAILMTEIGTTGIYQTTFTPNSTGNWQARAYSVIYPEQRDCKSFFVGTEYDLYPAQEDGHLLSLDTKIGEVQTTPTSNTVLGRLKDIWDKLVELFNPTNGTAKLKIWDGTNVAGVTSANRLKVEASLTNLNSSLPVHIKYEKSLSAINANEWQEILEYIVPTGYRLTINAFRCYSTTAAESARVYIETKAAEYICSTNTFTDLSSIVAPQFGSGLYAIVTTQIGSSQNDTFTITYTNELGVTNRTCTIVIPKSSLVGTSIEGNLEGNDIGIRDITNITHSATGQNGAIRIDLHYSIFNLLMTASGTMYQAQSTCGNPITFAAGTMIVMGILAGTKTSYVRFLSLSGTLDPL